MGQITKKAKKMQYLLKNCTTFSTLDATAWVANRMRAGQTESYAARLIANNSRLLLFEHQHEFIQCGNTQARGSFNGMWRHPIGRPYESGLFLAGRAKYLPQTSKTERTGNPITAACV